MVRDKIRGLINEHHVDYRYGTLVQKGSRKHYDITPWIKYVDEFRGISEGNLRVKIIEEIESMKKEEKGNGSAEYNSEYKLPTANDTREFIANACTHFGVEIGVMGENGTPGFGIKEKGGEYTPVAFNEVGALVRRYITEYKEDTRINGPEDKDLKRHTYSVGDTINYLEDMPREYHQTALDNIRKNTQYDENYKEYPAGYVHQYLTAMKAKGDINLNVAVLLHWLWQVKRFLFGYKVIDPIFLNLYGSNQGIGKTFFVDLLKRPINGFYKGAALNEVLDDRTYSAWAKYYIMHFEELSRGKMEANQAGDLIAGLKRILTDTYISYRELGSHRHAILKRIASAIATANYSVNKVIQDETGMRRFFEIELMAEKKDKPYTVLQEWEKSPHIINGIWRGIDESAASPLDLYNMREELYKIQSSYKPENCVSLYLHYAEDPQEPITQDSKAAISLLQEFTEIRSTSSDKVAEMAASKGLVALKIGTWREEITDWYKQTGQNAKYVTGVANMAPMLESMGYFVLKVNRMQFVFTVMG